MEPRTANLTIGLAVGATEVKSGRCRDKLVSLSQGRPRCSRPRNSEVGYQFPSLLPTPKASFSLLKQCNSQFTVNDKM